MFKDFLRKDFETFFNVNEFSETHNIDGKDIDISIDDDELKERQAKFAEGTYIGSLLFYAKESDFEEMPVIEQRMKYDGELYEVADIQENHGVYTITLRGYMS